MKNTFRTAAVGGFNRQDVMDYITKSAAEHEEAIRALEEERDTLAGAVDERDALADRVAELTAHLEKQAAEYCQLKDHLAQAEVDNRRRGEAIVVQAEEQSAAILSKANAEAEEILRQANAEAAAIRRSVVEQIQAISFDYAQFLRDMDTVKNHVTNELRKMDVSLSQLPLSFNKMSNGLKELEKRAQA